jgi:hypothetical protein
MDDDMESDSLSTSAVASGDMTDQWIWSTSSTNDPYHDSDFSKMNFWRFWRDNYNLKILRF